MTTLDVPQITRDIKEMIRNGDTYRRQDSGLEIFFLRSKNNAILLSDIQLVFKHESWITNFILTRLAASIIFSLEINSYQDYGDVEYGIEVKAPMLVIRVTNYNIKRG